MNYLCSGENKTHGDIMTPKTFFKKFLSLYLWGNLLAMAVVVVALCAGVKYGLDVYTHHGESIPVPDLRNMDYAEARRLMEQDRLRLVVSDSGYNKRKPADCILAQNPEAGARVKSGHIIYVTLNTLTSPTLPLPDIVDNSSVREAEARLRAMGFTLLEPEYVTGEKDWVYGIVSQGRNVGKGDMVSVEAPLRLLVGGGLQEDDYEEVDFDDAADTTAEAGIGMSAETDDFEEVTGPPETTNGKDAYTQDEP